MSTEKNWMFSVLIILFTLLLFTIKASCKAEDR